jgi:6-phosphogluconolactonase
LKKEIKIFSSPIELAENFARELVRMIIVSADKKKTFTIALSGGTTPKILYSVLGNHFSDSISWKSVHFFWGDERCVPPEDPESNFGMAKRILFDKIRIPSANIHRIMGEKDPSKEATRYSNEIAGHTRERRGSPVFDMIILGLGDDGHTASIFPANCELLKSKHICEVSVNPKSLQKRITITGIVINNAENVVFIVTGENKAEMVSAIINNTSAVNYPAARIEPKNGILKWYLDIAAGKMIDRTRQN